MASLLESLGQVLTPEAMTSLGNALGLDPEMVQQGVNVVGPLVQGGLANTPPLRRDWTVLYKC